MRETEIMQVVREHSLESFESVLSQLGAVRIDTNEYAFPIDVEGAVRYAKVKFSAAKEGFDGEAVAQEFSEVLAKREDKAREDARLRALKAEEKLAKAKARLEM